eukprot:93428-Rhodomonas_salina.2
MVLPELGPYKLVEPPRRCCTSYAMSGTDIAYGAIGLRISGTDLPCGVRCPVLSERTIPSC